MSRLFWVGVAIAAGFFLSVFVDDKGDSYIKYLGKKYLGVDIPVVNDNGDIV
jgi:hypothetical protein